MIIALSVKEAVDCIAVRQVNFLILLLALSAEGLNSQLVVSFHLVV